MSVSLHVDLTQFKEIAARLNAALVDLGGDATDLMDEIGAALVTAVLDRFERGVDPEDRPWAKSLRAQTEGGQTLVDTAHLMHSITHHASRTSVAVGTNRIYASAHQTGVEITAKTKRGMRFRVGSQWVTKHSITVKARPFLGLSAQDESTVDSIVTDYLSRVIEGAGR